MSIEQKKADQLAAKAAQINRQRFRKRFPQTTLILAGRKATSRNGDVEYNFRQTSDFIHLSACDLPDCILIIGPGIDLLCIPETDEHHLVWLGEAETKQSAKLKFGFKRCIYLEEIQKEWPKIIQKSEQFLCSEELKDDLLAINKRLKVEIFQADKDLEHLRVIKNDSEIALMQKAADAASAAHLEVMISVQPSMFEWEVKDLFDTTLKENGVREHSFPTIAGTGRNGAVLHYTREQTKLRRGELLLLDAGGEHKGYASDITRTYPVNGKFTIRQKQLYELVLKAQEESIQMIEPGVWMSDLQENVIRILTEGMLKYGFLKGDLKDLISKKCISLFYPHGCSHQLGLDVHDISPPQRKPGAKVKVRSNQCLEAGMVITMEPGLYFIEAVLKNPEHRKKHRAHINFNKVDSYLDFGGIRIEDDILVTRNGHRVLSDVPKSVEDIELLKQI